MAATVATDTASALLMPRLTTDSATAMEAMAATDTASALLMLRLTMAATAMAVTDTASALLMLRLTTALEAMAATAMAATDTESNSLPSTRITNCLDLNSLEH